MPHSLRHILSSLTLLLLTAFSSCVELVDFKDPVDAIPADSLPVTLLQQELYIMVGDSCRLDVQIPDSLKMTYYCTMDEGQSLVMKGRRVYAMQPGDQEVSVHVTLFSNTSISQEKTLTCRVHVFDWQADHLYSDYPYSMIRYCQIIIDGAEMSDQMEVAALSADGEVRGRAQWLEDGQVRYICLRIYSPEPSDELIYLYCYDHTRVQRIPLQPQSLLFDGQTRGTLSHLEQFTGSFDKEGE